MISIKKLGGGGLKQVLRDPNLALSFCYMTRIMKNGNRNVKHKTNIQSYGKQGEQLLEWATFYFYHYKSMETYILIATKVLLQQQ